jgi:hypothetical protein
MRIKVIIKRSHCQTRINSQKYLSHQNKIQKSWIHIKILRILNIMDF